MLDTTQDVSSNETKFHNWERFVDDNIRRWKTVVEDWVLLGNVLVVHYEKVLEDMVGESLKMLKFLSIDPPAWRVECARFCTFDMYKRKPGITPSSTPTFTVDMKEKIDSVIKEINILLVKHGHARVV